MRYLTGTGGEKIPDGVDPLSVMVERSVAIGAMSDALLAWEMNGVPITLAHGGPLRLIVPGYNGVNNVKYVKRVAFTEAESQAKIMSTGYRMTALGGTSKAERSLDPGAQRQVVRDRTFRRPARSRRHGLGDRRRLQAAARRSAGSRCRATAARPGSRPPSSAGPRPLRLAAVRDSPAHDRGRVRAWSAAPSTPPARRSRARRGERRRLQPQRLVRAGGQACRRLTAGGPGRPAPSSAASVRSPRRALIAALALP
jgi:DMSO/TMAO reductase YedYZ molybdopterin-dependent catalytic subunit